MSSQYFRFLARDQAHRRSPLLEQLIARADEWAPVSDWRADAFRVIAPQAACMPAVAAAALCAERTAGGAAARDAAAGDADWVCMATPVHYVAEMTSVRMAADGMLTLSPAAAEALAADFNRIWQGSGIRMAAARSAQLFCIFDRALQVATRDPEDVLDRHIEEFLPGGEDAPRLRRLISETEMWLFDNAGNRARTDQGLPLINGLWFWGGGAPVASLPQVHGWTAGDDVFFGALGAARDDNFHSGVVAVRCVPGAENWREVESRWLHPAIRDLKARRISRLHICAAGRAFTVTRRGLRRFWRRAKPWWESFE